VSFPVIKGKTLVNMLLETSENCAMDFNLDEREAIMEVGNLIINAVQGVISDMVGQEVECQLPEINFDDRILPVDILREDDIYIFGEMILAVKGIDIEGSILLIYAYENLELLLEKFLSLYEED
jgi:chemotaxis protein CheY-P-specific phosphatase CheC